MTEHTCLLCRTTADTRTVSERLRDDSLGSHSVVQCLTCGHVQLVPMPAPEDDARFYAGDEQSRRLTGPAEIEAWRKRTWVDTQRRLEWIRSRVGPSDRTLEILDVGCGYGFVVDALARKGYRAIGMDVGTERLEIARSHHQGAFVEGTVGGQFLKENQGRFGCLTLFHDLEHVRDPVTFLQLSCCAVRPGGFVLIEVPNLVDELLTYSASYRAFYWQRAHLSYFDAARLSLVLIRAGFAEFEVRGVQRYGLRNLIHWLDRGEPQLDDPDFTATNPMLAKVEDAYRSERERGMTCDTLVAEIRI
jgi:SAM-dependent methyltransferase